MQVQGLGRLGAYRLGRRCGVSRYRLNNSSRHHGSLRIELRLVPHVRLVHLLRLIHTSSGSVGGSIGGGLGSVAGLLRGIF